MASEDSFLVLDDVKYNSFVIGSDEGLEVLFHCHRQFSEVKTLELLVKLVDVVSNSDGIEDVLRNDVDDDDAEPDIIADDSGDDIAGSNSVGGGGASSSGTQQYLPHFSNLDLNAMRQ
ncbi:hypothetical protein Ahy_A10g049420 [Arachis hypogaea]|uniref:Uncharacterized protein n=1 Tax=Arachis hypogaea TaxID=3818 RepID=A0A445B751_ARAHY|nr:hypothetical protein Ahy_A10g049420 [Arachis hypogaea]